MKHRKAHTANTQEGFTFIEIIAVLVILGILAAVAVPKYMDLENQARIKSGQSAIAETKTRLATAYGQYLLANKGSAPANILTLCNFINNTSILPKDGNGNVPMGSDYEVTLNNKGLITVTKVVGVTVNGVTSTWNLPN